MTHPARHLLPAGIALALATGTWALISADSAHPTGPSAEATAPTLSQMNAPSPSMAFEPNHGQTADHVDYVSRGEGYGLFLSPTEAVFSLRPARTEGSPGEARADAARPREDGSSVSAAQRVAVVLEVLQHDHQRGVGDPAGAQDVLVAGKLFDHP